MSPVAITSSGVVERLKSVPGSNAPTPPYATPMDIATSNNIIHDSMLDTPARRPSPWHDLAHSLSTTALPQRRSSASFSISASLSSTSSSLNTPSHPSPPLSTSQALREWEERLARPTSAFSRHALLTSPSPVSNSPSPKIVPKLEPERDKEGHIEYKLKLINPSGDRFERLVTQMMWRLKQGRNEAIYELGLADDGTVIGLSRADMDASLRTLELMASEVGATVLVLKEIVLAGSSSITPIVESVHAEKATVAAPVKKKRGWGRKRRERQDAYDQRQSPAQVESTFHSQIGCSRRIVFDPNDLDDNSDDEDGQVNPDIAAPVDIDEDVPTFHLDLEDAVQGSPVISADMSEPASPTASSSTGSSWKRRRNRTHKIRQITEEDRLEQEKKATTKAAKSMARRESRRLDLLRGDGMSFGVVSDPLQAYPQPGAVDSSSSSLPHAPARPSSLRLTTPPATIDAQHVTGETMDDLLITPLDSLSLSFADVQTMRPRSLSSSSSSSTEYAPTMVDTPILGTERICVEALVVRKVQHEEEEDGWGWGGMDDVWGLSAEAYDTPVVEEDPVDVDQTDEDEDDPWGF